MQSLISYFTGQIRDEVDLLIESFSSYFLERLIVKDGVVRQVPENSVVILDFENVFHRELNRSGFYPSILALIETFVDQVDEFREMYAEMGDLPEVQLDSDDHELLGNQAAAAIGAIEGHVLRVGLALRNLLSRSLGEVNLSELVTGISTVVRRLNDVELVAKDQLILFFRMTGNLHYRTLEENGHQCRYVYVGPVDDKSRSFCSRLLGKELSRKEIDALDNGQLPGVFDVGGGYGCRHWWALQEAA
jgi:hypothetical protein